jgi:lysophospholipase L1-like esterase
VCLKEIVREYMRAKSQKLSSIFNLELISSAIFVSILMPASAQQIVRYVAMGSSSAAGPGVGIYDPDSGSCSRSKSNYARLLAEKWHFDLYDVSCSGATIQNILYKNPGGSPAQIDAVDTTTKLVTVTIGANDVYYAANLLGYSLIDSGKNGHIISDAEVEKRFDLLKEGLTTIASEVHRRAPLATLVFVGNLPVLPEDGTSCPLQIPLNNEDVLRMHQVYDRLNSAIHSVAMSTGNRDVRGSLIGQGHDACSPVPFVTDYHPPTNATWHSPIPYHPNQLGMQALAKAIEDSIPPEKGFLIK